VENRSCCDTRTKVKALLEGAGFVAIKAWTEEIVHAWRPEDHFEYQLRGSWRPEIESLTPDARQDCLARVQDRLRGLGRDQYVFRGEVVVATAFKPTVPARRRPRAADNSSNFSPGDDHG
jgi:hypothetical protein